jgi:hypothetical protein
MQTLPVSQRNAWTDGIAGLVAQARGQVWRGWLNQPCVSMNDSPLPTAPRLQRKLCSLSTLIELNYFCITFEIVTMRAGFSGEDDGFPE